MEYKLDVNTHGSVGPYPAYGHDGLTLVNSTDAECEVSSSICVCLDCGYIADDIRMFAHEECDRSMNGINQTWRERLEGQGFPEAFEG